MRRTKIVATVGPATAGLREITRLIEAGADVLRLNFSHGSPDQHAETVSHARKASERVRKEVALLADLPGPKLRLGDIDGRVVELSKGQLVKLTTKTVPGTVEEIPISWPQLPEAVNEGDVIYLADGTIRLRVRGRSREEVLTEVEIGGTVTSRQGMNLPGVEVGLPTVSETDFRWIDFAIDQKMDLIAVSFVRRRADLDPVAEKLAERGVDTPLIAKIENAQAATNAAEIVKSCTGGIMVARGDLGIELPIEMVPLVQKRLVRLAGRFSKPSIIATQMLASMVHSSRPTRAEASDVANAIYDGADAVMLSEETAVGDYPTEAVSTVVEIARATEKELPYGDWLVSRTGREREVAESVAYGAVASVYQLGLVALVVPTSSGRTARLVSAHRPQAPVLALSPRLETTRRLNLLFGVTPALNEEPQSLNELLDECAERAKELGVAKSGDLIGITAGLPNQRLGTNLLEVHRVP